MSYRLKAGGLGFIKICFRKEKTSNKEQKDRKIIFPHLILLRV